MNRPLPASPALRTRGARIVATLALCGLFAMHGWGTHGTMSHGHEMSPTVGTHAMTDASASCDCPDDGQPTTDSDSESVLALCLAVLVALVAMAVRLLIRRLTWARVARWARAELPPLIRRDRDPPNRFALCVIRC